MRAPLLHLMLASALASSCAISDRVTQRYGSRAGQAADRATNLIVSWGPTIGGNGRISEAGADGAVSGGLFASAVVLAAEPVRNTARGYNVQLPAIANADLVAHLRAELADQVGAVQVAARFADRKEDVHEGTCGAGLFRWAR